MRAATLLGLAAVLVLATAASAESAGGAVAAPPAPASVPSDVEREVAALDGRIARLRAELSAAPAAASFAAAERALAQGRLAYALLQRSTLTADFADFRAAELAIEETGRLAGPSADVALLRAQLALKVHRLAAAERALDSLPELAADPEVLALRGDIALQRGRYGAARSLYGRALAAGRSWDALARLAYLAAKTGERKEALRLYAEAADLLTAKEMRSYSWLSFQLGLLELGEERHAAALAHFERAERAFSGDWQVAIHRAEALARLGGADEAIAIDRAVFERTGNPEVANDLGLLLRRREPAEAARLFALADAGFAARMELYPEAAAGHWIEGRLARGGSPGERSELLDLAAEGYRLRPYGAPGELLARACLEAGERGRAREVVAEVAAGGWRTPELRRLRQRLAGGGAR